MKVLLITFTVISSIILSANTDEIADDFAVRILQFEFDSKLNRYFTVYQGGDSQYDRFYKVINGEDYSIRKDFYHVWKILINLQDEAFLFVSNETEHALEKQSVWFLKPDSEYTNRLFNFNGKGKYNDTSYFIDKDNFIYFNTRSGVSAIRPDNITSPVGIVNLDNFVFDQHIEDRHGNVLLVDSTKQENAVAVILRDSKQSKILSGDIQATMEVYEKVKRGRAVDDEDEESGIGTAGSVYIAIAVIGAVALLFVAYKGWLCDFCARSVRGKNHRNRRGGRGDVQVDIDSD